MTTEERLEKKHEEDLERIRRFRLMDDDFMTACLDGNPKAVELILRIIMNEPDLIVTNVSVQHFIKNLLNRSVKLDVFATDEEDKKYNVEVQREDKGAGSKRARYNSSVIDAKIMETGEKFDSLPESNVIFITENDVMGEGEPMYHIERCIMETGKQFRDEAHIIYVNGTYRGDDPLGRLMADFNCTEPENMYYDILKERVSYFKKTKEGVAIMCRAMEEMREQERAEGRKEGERIGYAAGRLEAAVNLMKQGKLTFEEIAECCKLTLEEVQALS